MKLIQSLCICLGIAMIVGCSSSGGDAPPNTNPPDNNPPPVGGIGRTGIALGPISTFGSIVVNGVRYDTSSASFTVDDNPGSQDDLSVGQVVAVQGTINDDLLTGSADIVIFDDNVTGPVESIDLALGQLVVLGQTVNVGADTSFDDSFSPASIDGVMVGDIAEVSGLFEADDSIAATRIEKKLPSEQLEVHGTVTNLDSGNSTFMLNALVVDYSGATLDDFPGGEISDGDFVEAKGNGLGAAGELVATKVELETLPIEANDGDRVEIEGFITRFDSAQDFDISGFAVTTTAGTVYEGGTEANLGLNVRIEVEGDLNASDVIVAEKIEFEGELAVELTALVDSVDEANDSLVVLGVTINVDATTRFEDKSNEERDPLTLGDIVAGNYVEIRGDEDPPGSGEIRAGRLERDDVDNRTILQGFVENVSRPTLTILGVSIETGGQTEYRDENEVPISANEFFSRVQQGSLVKVDGSETSATTILADEVELEGNN